MTLKNNRAPLLSNIKPYASFHHHMWIQTGVTVRKRLSWVVTSVTLTFDLWPWPFAWTLRWSLVITPENLMMIRWWEHSQKGVTDRRTDGRTDGQTENTICRAAWSQLKITMDWYFYLLKGHIDCDIPCVMRSNTNIEHFIKNNKKNCMKCHENCSQVSPINIVFFTVKTQCWLQNHHFFLCVSFEHYGFIKRVRLWHDIF